ncbi:hypothetical protein [Endozoicomonas numazuensis]|uniref:C2H2-type domain-containing protein n=1 Tax=Endozoicomonas numazuensis TaxID=1137799 RepID=A0A081NG12_9GAMM|nr:hypothetical protein [Endozoicomonas numazuensis]KEQ17385.1 hypothetical protein GZ78_16450 [Endozoicomonas numazuensis]
MFLPLFLLIGWGALQASMDEQPGIPFRHEALLLFFLNPLLDAYAPINPALMMNKFQVNGLSSQDVFFEPVLGKSLISLYSGLPGIMQWGGVISRSSSDEGTPPNGRSTPADEDDDLEEEESSTSGVVAAGGEDRKDNNEDENRAEPEDKKDPILCWHCQDKRVCWQYSCCDRGLCEDCYRGFGVSPVKCPCCGKSRRPRVSCQLCPVDHEPMELDQPGFMVHLYTEHLQQRCRARINQICQHCSQPIALFLPLQELLSALLSHCYAFCIFPGCGTVLTAENDNTAHFESSHKGQAGCPISVCPMNQLANIQPSASHMNSHLQYSCCFCSVSFNNLQTLQTHLTTHIQSYSCSICQGHAGPSFLLMLVNNVQQVQVAAVPLNSEESMINHWTTVHCQINCPLCAFHHQGCDDVSMQEHIDNECSRVDRLSRPVQEQGELNLGP